MLNNKTPTKTRNVVITSNSIEIIVGDDDSQHISLVLPSANDIAELRDGQFLHFSIKEYLLSDPLSIGVIYRNELDQLLDKSDKYKLSPTYLSNVIQLCKKLGERELLSKYQKDLSRIIASNSALDVGRTFNRNHVEHSSAGQDSDATDIDYLIRSALVTLHNPTNDKYPLDFIDRALLIDPLNHRARLYAGALYIASGGFEQAIRHLKIAEERYNKSSSLYTNKAIAYWGLNQRSKSIQELRKAVALDPLNKNAVIFYSDAVCLAEDHNHEIDVINALERYVEYDQKERQVWLSLGRAYFYAHFNNSRDQDSPSSKNMLRAALHALRQAEEIESEINVWNNMGLVLWALDDLLKATRYFMQGIKIRSDDGKDLQRVVYNLAGLLIDSSKYLVARDMLKEFRENTSGGNVDGFTEKLALQYVVTLEATGNRREAFNLSRQLVSGNIDDKTIKIDLLSRILYYMTVIELDSEAAMGICNEIIDLIVNSSDRKTDKNATSDRALNNVIFALLLMGDTDRAHSLLGYISNCFHKDPYSTATLGMVHLKANRIDKGVALYREAISLVLSEKDKNKFRQRLEYELGKLHIASGSFSKAQRCLSKAIAFKHGIPSVNMQIEAELKSLPINPS